MNKKILIAWVLLIIPLTNLTAQESFLKLDSIQVINGTLIKIQNPSDGRYRTGRDTITISTSNTSIIKIHNILMEIELNDSQGYWGSNDSRPQYSIRLNNRLLMFRKTSPIQEEEKLHLEYFDIIENSEINLTIEGTSYSFYSYKNPWEFHYRIELHHYSYE